jgi:hypothetical protein
MCVYIYILVFNSLLSMMNADMADKCLTDKSAAIIKLIMSTFSDFAVEEKTVSRRPTYSSGKDLIFIGGVETDTHTHTAR